MANEKLDLISRDEALEVLCDYCSIEGHCSADGCAEYQKISKLTTVDAVPVVHGRWVKVDHYPPECSICGDIAPLTCDGEAHYMGNYCPNCGAKMDGGNEDG